MEALFHRVEKDVATFQTATGLHCATGCGLCCFKPDIYATRLEFLPLAYELAKKDLANKWLEELSDREDSVCINLSKLISANGGFCHNYKHRGLICRLFGFSAMKVKGKPTLVTCKTIKTGSPESHTMAIQHLKENKPAPLVSSYYTQLKSIDPDLGSELLPINEAIKGAIKTVLSYYAYRRIRRTG